MRSDLALKFLRALGVKRTHQSGDWLVCPCPLAPWTHSSGKDENPSFAILVDPGKPGVYNCFACGHGGIFDLFMALRRHGHQFADFDTARDISVDEDEAIPPTVIKEYGTHPEQPKIFPFSEFWLKTFKKAVDVPLAMEYLEKRRVPVQLVADADLRFDTARKAVCFPIRDYEGMLVGLRGRRVDPEEGEPKYHIYKSGEGNHNPLVWYGEHWADPDKPVVIVESVFDALRVREVYPNVIAPLSANWGAMKAKRIGRFSMLLVVPDHDLAGDEMVVNLHRYLPNTNIKVVHLPFDDPNDERKDPADCTPAEITDILRPFIPKL